MPQIVITDPAHVLIDGQSAGTVVDVIANHASNAADPAHVAFRAAFQAAIVTYHDGRQKAHNDALDAASAKHAKDLADARTAYQAELAKHHADNLALAQTHAADLKALSDAQEAKIAEATEKLRDKNASLQKTQAEHLRQIDALGGTELGQKMLAEKRRRQLQDAIARHQAELAALAKLSTPTQTGA